jgi:hypothetical protein
VLSGASSSPSRPAFRHRRVEHLDRGVGQERHAQATRLQSAERRRHVRPDIELEESLRQAIAQIRREIDLARRGGDRQRLLRDLPEIGIATGERAQPRVFELTRAPGLHELGATAGEERLGAQGNGPRIDEGKAIEGDGLVARGTVGAGGRERAQDG